MENGRQVSEKDGKEKKKEKGTQSHTLL